MDDPEADLVSSEPDALGAEFITVELDTQPIEYVVKWAEVGSKFTISCVKKDSDDPNELPPDQLKFESDETFFAPYEEVYPCELTEQSVEIKTDSDSGGEEEEEEEEMGGEVEEEEEEDEDEAETTAGEEEAGSSQLDGEGDGDSDQVDYEPRQRQYRCSYCGKCYSHASSLYRHQQMHAGKGAAMSGGAKRPPQTYSPMVSAAAAGESRYACPHCGMSFKGSRMLGSHLRLHGKRRIHPCNICGKEFNHSSSLSRHRLVHKKDKSGLGPNGAAATGPQHHRRRRGGGGAGVRAGGGKGKRGRRQQQRAAPGPEHEAPQAAGAQMASAAVQVHAQGGEKFYACPQCDMTFRTSTLLSKHQVSHVKDLLDNYTPGKENLGESSSDLKIRLKLCSRDKPNFYTLCKKNRRRRGGARGGRRGPAASAADTPLAAGLAGSDEEYHRHQLLGGAHGCSLCDKSFGHASGLARHQQVHRGGGGVGGGGRGGKAFHQRAQFHRKRGSAHAGKVYACAACDKTFMHSSSYSRHKKAHMQQQQLGPGHERALKRRKREPVDESAPLESDSE